MIRTKSEREKLRKMIQNEILSTSEVLEILDFSRERLKQVNQDGRLTPIARGIYLKDDVLAFKRDRERRIGGS